MKLDVQNQSAAMCPHLRTKTAYGTYEGMAHWSTGESTTAVYWCLKTMGPAGPDENLAHPHKCGSGRACFEADD